MVFSADIINESADWSVSLSISQAGSEEEAGLAL